MKRKSTRGKHEKGMEIDVPSLGVPSTFYLDGKRFRFSNYSPTWNYRRTQVSGHFQGHDVTISYEHVLGENGRSQTYVEVDGERTVANNTKELREHRKYIERILGHLSEKRSRWYKQYENAR